MRIAKLVFIGGGNMSRSIVSGLVEDGYDSHSIWVVDPNADKRQFFMNQLGTHAVEDAAEAIKVADIVILAVKPQAMSEVAKTHGAQIKTKQALVISIAAGITCNDLQQWFGHKTPVIRCMPNTPALVKAGMSTLYAGDQASKQQQDLAERILRAVGVVTWIQDETLMDAVTALSGSSPGYLYLIMQIMQETGEKMGLDPKTARTLVLQSIFGSAKLALESQEPFDVLQSQVTSKGGTTQAAIESLQADGVAQLLERALAAAQARGAELSKAFGSQRHLPNQSESS